MVANRHDEIRADDALVESWIESNPFKPGTADARVREYGVPVWALIGYLQGYDGDVGRVARAYGIPVESVQAAAAFYARHEAVIDVRMAANRE